MKIQHNAVVNFHYELSEPNSDFREDSRGDHPVAYLHGHGNILPALEEALLDKEAGETVTVTLSAAQAYGERQENAVQRIPVKHLRFNGNKPKAGDIAFVETKDGMRQVTVVKPGLKMVDIDSNHPLAGKTLTFQISVISVREATAEEIDHGHAHGDGGHHH